MSRGVSRDLKQFLKIVSGQKWQPDIVSFHFLNKKKKFTSCQILRNNSLPISQLQNLADCITEA